MLSELSGQVTTWRAANKEVLSAMATMATAHTSQCAEYVSCVVSDHPNNNNEREPRRSHCINTASVRLCLCEALTHDSTLTAHCSAILSAQGQCGHRRKAPSQKSTFPKK